MSTDAFGYNRFDQIYTASFNLRDNPLTAYYSRRKTPREAEELAASYHEFLASFGGQPIDSDLEIKTAKIIYIMDSYEIVFSYGHYLAGVREATDKQASQELAMQLFNRIKEATDE